MEEEFYATIKLLSGEELLSKVCYSSEEDILILEKPLLVEPAVQKKGQTEVSGFSLREWIIASFDQMFVIEKKNILTITEVEDKIINFYNLTLKRITDGVIEKPDKLTRKSGYLGSIEQKKKSLEDIFKKS